MKSKPAQSPEYYPLNATELKSYSLTKKEYDRKNCIVIEHNSGPHGDLLNMNIKYPLLVNGREFKSLEHLYQACRYPKVVQMQNDIMTKPSPLVAKWVSKPHKAHGRTDWYQEKVKIMKWCLRVKLACNYGKFGYALNATGNNVIVETSPDGDFWGAIPKDKKDKASSLIGANVFGQLLVELREEYRTKPKEELLVVKPLKIKDFLLFGKPVEIVDRRDSTINKKFIKYGDEGVLETFPDLPEESRILLEATGSDEEGEGIKVTPEVFYDSEMNLTKMTTTDWDDYFTMPIRKAMHDQNIGKPLKILGYISEMSNPRAIFVGVEGEKRTILLISVADNNDNEIKCFPVLIDNYPELQVSGEPSIQKFYIFAGTVYPKYVEDEGGVYMFSIRKIFKDVNAEDRIYVRHELGDRVAKLFLAEHTKKKRIFNYIKKTLVDKLGVKGIDKIPHISKSIDFMIYQSLSNGVNPRPRYSNKLHSLVIGHPGAGKNFLIQVASILNPVFGQPSAVGQKITPAALIGDVKTKGPKRISNPGYLPRSSGGVVCMQDTHGFSAYKAAVFQAFAEVMEDGTTTDSTAARTKHEAVTSIHMDLNRISHIDPRTKVDNYSDVKIPIQVISRLDYICDIPDEESQAFEVAEEMLTGPAIVSGYDDDISVEIWKRDLKRIIAYLATYFRMVDIPSNVNEYARLKISKLFKANEKLTKISQNKILEFNAVRLARSVHKFVKAIACSETRLRATKKDVDRAFEFIEEKLKFLALYEPLIIPGGLLNSRSDAKKKRQELLADVFRKKKQFTYEEAKKVYVDKFGQSASSRTLDRDIKEMVGTTIEKVGKGIFAVLKK